MRFRHLPIAPPLVCLLLAALLGTPGAARADGEIIDPCKLVTAEEVQVLLESPVDRASEVHVKDPVKFPIRICSFHGKNGRTLNLSTGIADAASFAAEWTGQDKLAGLGDAAYGVLPGVIAFLKGASSCKLQALNFGFSRDGRGRGLPAPVVTARLLTLAQTALGRM